MVWVDHQGAERPYGGIEPGADITQPSFARHVWRLKEWETGLVLGTFVVAESPPEQRFTIRDAVR
jgi:hypothetical protein